MKEILKNIDESIDHMVELGKETTKFTPLCAYDLFCSIIIVRYVKILRGFTGLMRHNNYVSALPLVKALLDLLLQLYASTLVSYSVDEFAKRVFKGRQIRYMRDTHGRLLQKKYLLKNISKIEGLGWISAVNDKEYSCIHYSDYVFNRSVNSYLEDDKKVIDFILTGDEFVPNAEKIELSIKVNRITKNIVNLIASYRAQREGCCKPTDNIIVV